MPKQDKKVAVSKQYEKVEWMDFQIGVLSKMDSEEPIIDWFVVDPGAGRSYLARYLYVKEDVILLSECRQSVCNQVGQYHREHDEFPRVFVYDTGHHIDYDILTRIYDRTFIVDLMIDVEPRIIVMSTQFPDLTKISSKTVRVHDNRDDIL